MDEKLHILHHLYGDGEDPAALRRLLEDEAVREEFEALSAVKAHLDHRERARPDAQVIDRIMAAAAVPPRPEPLPGRRSDRAAQPGRLIRRYRLVGALAATLAVVLAVSIGLNQYSEITRMAPAADEQSALMKNLEPSPEEAEAVASEFKEEEAPALGRQDGRREARQARAAELLDQVAPLDQPVPAASGLALRDAMANEAGEEAPPAWDDADELLQVHRRIELIRARSLEGIWDESVVMSLDSLPSQQPPPSGLNAASTRRDNDQ